jgi:hypothetical protein
MLKCVNIPNVAASTEKKSTQDVRLNPSLLGLGVKTSQPKNLSKKFAIFLVLGQMGSFPATSIT